MQSHMHRSLLLVLSMVLACLFWLPAHAYAADGSSVADQSTALHGKSLAETHDAATSGTTADNQPEKMYTNDDQMPPPRGQ